MKKILKAVLFVVICYCVALVSSFVFLDQIVVSGDSMNENLQNGEIGFADKQIYKLSGLKRFDIVVIEHEGSSIIKRVIGLPNETISYKDGVLKINGEVVEEEFINEDNKKNTIRYGDKIDLTLGENEYYVLGDNRKISLDSRNFGPVNKMQIKSRLFMITGECESNMQCDTNDVCVCKKKYFWPRFY